MAFGLKKHIQAQQGIPELQQQLDELRQKRANLKNKEIEFKLKIDAIEKKNKEHARVDARIRTYELDSLKEQGTVVSQFTLTLHETSSPKQSAQ